MKRNITIILNKTTCILLIISFIFATILPSQVQAQVIYANMPAPGTMIAQTPAYAPAILKGMTVYPDSPFEFDFIIDSGESTLSDKDLEEETKKMIRYFLTSLTIPKDDLWVNLSPEEPDRIVPTELGKTELGR